MAGTLPSAAFSGLWSGPPAESPFAAALRAAVRSRGLTLDRLRYHLARRGLTVGQSSLSDWQQGRSLPASAKSLRAVRALEEILELPPGALSCLLDAGRRVTRAGLNEQSTPVGPLLDVFSDISTDIDVLAHSCEAFIDRQRHCSLTWSHFVVRARRDGLDRYVARFLGDPGCRIDRVGFGRLGNCRLGRVLRRTDPRGPALVGELLFDRPLVAGETWVFDFEIRCETGRPTVEFAHAFRQPVGQFVIQVKFEVDLHPVDCHAFALDRLGETARRLWDLRLTGYRTAHLAATEVGLGVLGIAWSWGGGGNGTSAADRVGPG